MPQSEAYRKHFALSYSGMKKLKITPAHFYAWHHNPARSETKDMALGTLTHLLLLEPKREPTDVALWTGKVKNGKVWDAFKKVNKGKLIVKPDELKDARNMVQAISKNPFVVKALTHPEGRAELEFFGEDEIFGDVPVKCTFDWITPELVLDLKKTAGTIEEFELYSIEKYNYDVQMMFYLRLAERMDGIKRQGAWIVVEDEPPHATMLVLPNEYHIERGTRIVEEMLGRFMVCLQSGTWPGYDTFMKIAEVPEWKARKAAQS